MQASVQRIKRSLDSKCIYENSKVGKRGSKRKFSARTERKVIHVDKSITRATSHELEISLQMYRVNVCDSSIRSKFISAGLTTHRPQKKAKITSAMTKKRLTWAKFVKEKFGNGCSVVRNVYFNLINQLNSRCSFLLLKSCFFAC